MVGAVSMKVSEIRWKAALTDKKFSRKEKIRGVAPYKLVKHFCHAWRRQCHNAARMDLFNNNLIFLIALRCPQSFLELHLFQLHHFSG